jgi:ATP-dependent Clp protease ATP-binding subunit ClpA
MIFMTSNLGAAEMTALVNPKFGFGATEQAQQCKSGAADADLDEKITRIGVAAARGRFTPEFINRIDRVVTFNPLGTDQWNQGKVALSRIPSSRFHKESLAFSISSKRTKLIFIVSAWYWFTISWQCVSRWPKCPGGGADQL